MLTPSVVRSLVLCLCLVLALSLAGCAAAGPEPADTGQPPAANTTTPAAVSQPPVTYGPVTVLPTDDDPGGAIRFSGVTLTSGRLAEDYSSPWWGDHHQGELFYLISGRVYNSSENRCWVAYHAYGYDASGNQVSFTLDEGPIAGIAQTGLEPGVTEEFTLHLTWADNATAFTVFSQKSPQMFP